MTWLLDKSRALVPSAVLLALLPLQAAANTPCTIAGTVETCTGDQSSGITPVAGVTVLNVDALSGPIAPPFGVAGINFQSFAGSGGITINSTANITTGGNLGIIAYNQNFPGNSGPVTVNSAGSVIGGISAFSEGTIAGRVVVTTSGSVVGPMDAIDAISSAATTSGGATVVNTGTITSTGAAGILALSRVTTGTSGAAVVTSTGTVSGATVGIIAINQATLGGDTGSVVVSASGTVTGGSIGIDAVNASFGGNAGSSTVTTSGVVSGGAYGILIQNVGVTVGNQTVNVLGGSVTGGTIAIAFGGGGVNTLNNFGTVANSNGITGIAVSGSGGTVAIENAGTITGSIALNAGVNAFDNLPGGQFNAGSDVNLGTGLLTNAGTLSPGGNGTIWTTALTGRLVQTGSGALAVDVNGGASDKLTVSGTAVLAGTVVVLPANITPGPHQWTILSAAGGVTDAGLSVVASPVLNARLLHPNSHDVVLAVALDYVTPGLTRNEASLADYLNRAGGAGLNPVLNGLLNTSSLSDYKTALAQLSPQIMSMAQIAAYYGAQSFATGLLDCRAAAGEGATLGRDGDCLWVRATGRSLRLAGTSTNLGVEDTTGAVSAGGQVALDPAWRLGVGFGYDTSSLRADTNAHTSGDTFNVGAILKYNPGPLLLAASLTAGWGWYDTVRPIAFGGFTDRATSANEIDVFTARLHASYRFDLAGRYVKPILEAGVARLDLEGVTETSGNAAALVVSGSRQTIFSVSPALEIGAELRFDGVSTWRPYLRAGLTWDSASDLTLSASFLDGPANAAPFTVHTRIDPVLADIGAGLEVTNAHGAALRFQYDGRFGETVRQHGVGLRGSVPF